MAIRAAIALAQPEEGQKPASQVSVDADKFGETQDAHVFFNQVIPEDVRQAYVQIGSSTESWGDVIVGRQVFAFGAERVIGPSDRTNASRTFDAVRLDLHQTGYQVRIFASSDVRILRQHQKGAIDKDHGRNDWEPSNHAAQDIPRRNSGTGRSLSAHCCQWTGHGKEGRAIA